MSELFDKGLKVRKEVLGEDYVNESIAGADEFTRTMAEWSTEICWGACGPGREWIAAPAASSIWRCSAR